FAAFDQLFPTNTFVQFQAGADLPRHTDIAPQTVFWRTALGQSFAANQGLGRMWSPMVEFVADRDLLDGAKTRWDIVPEMQVTISRRQHIRANVGFSKPFANTTGRQSQVVFYLLWDWADGKLTKGWGCEGFSSLRPQFQHSYLDSSPRCTRAAGSHLRCRNFRLQTGVSPAITA